MEPVLIAESVAPEVLEALAREVQVGGTHRKAWAASTKPGQAVQAFVELIARRRCAATAGRILALNASRSSRREIPFSTLRTFTQRPFAIGQLAWVAKATAVRSKTTFGLSTSSALPRESSAEASHPIQQTQELPKSALTAQRDGRPCVGRAQNLIKFDFRGFGRPKEHPPLTPI